MPVEISAEMQLSNKEKRHISKQQQSEPFLLKERGVIDFKGKGQVKTWFLAVGAPSDRPRLGKKARADRHGRRTFLCHPARPRGGDHAPSPD